jgi:hypothetical protein
LISQENLMEAERIGEVPGMEAPAAEAAVPTEQLRALRFRCRR